MFIPDDIVLKDNIHKDISDAIIQMISTGDLPYYGEFSLFINFIEAKIGTCGVNVSKKGMNFYWDRDFIEKQTRGSMIFIIIHEVLHLLCRHQKRFVGMDKKLANMAADMIINTAIQQDIMIGDRLGDQIEIPVDDEKKNSGVFVPKEYEGKHIFEDVYIWLKNRYDTWKEAHPEYSVKKLSKEDIENLRKNGLENLPWAPNLPKGREELDSEGNPRYDKYAQGDTEMYSLPTFFEDLELTKGMSFDAHFDDDVPEEVKNEVVGAVMDKLKARGLETGSITNILNKIRKQKKDYLKYIKRALSNDVFGVIKSKTIVKPNRRAIEGLKGKRKYKTEINAILDTSGSMSGSFEKVLSYIFQHDVQINLLQCDTEVKDVLKISKMSDLQKMQIKGLGGTCISPALSFIANNPKLNNKNSVILTDGYTDVFDFSNIKGYTLIISTGAEVKYINNKNRVKQIIIREEE
jgi:predicted metal-dependent peptidase